MQFWQHPQLKCIETNLSSTDILSTKCGQSWVRGTIRERNSTTVFQKKSASQCLLYSAHYSALLTLPSLFIDVLHWASWTTPSSSAHLFSIEKNIWKYGLPMLSRPWVNCSPTLASRRITWRVHSNADSWAPPTRNSHFYQISRCFWSNQSRDHTLRTTVLCPLDQSCWGGGSFPCGKSPNSAKNQVNVWKLPLLTAGL